MENALINGRYLLLAAVGSGGEARVFRARDMVTQDEVAVRLPLRPGVPAASEQPPAFHDGWVRLLGLGLDPQAGAYQIFELLEGRTLGELIRSGPLDPGEWRRFVDQSLDAVEALHAAGWTHDDLNADNFFQAASGWKLLELPFLRFEPPTGRSALFGSIHTLAPEQIDGARPGVGSDLYALGCLYYYAASGAWPHPGETSQEVAIHCLRFPPEPLGEKASGLPAPWSAWVMRLLAREPSHRPPTAAAARQLLGVA
ncbi:MAG TPA: serine/threonine-protein kinase [Candidatus Methylacidiphilales bacterium]|jgi:serine/threonine protein kinase|nr:serine/threonine-protein kinase [Candidatus Methylacidiphilales bacterium]